MTFRLFQQVALTRDFPDRSLRQGDVATIVDHHPIAQGEDGYSLEVFNALGETIAVLAVAESAIQSLSADEILHVRSLTPA